jgi:hypothetical protein
LKIFAGAIFYRAFDAGDIDAGEIYFENLSWSRFHDFGFLMIFGDFP